VVDFGVVPGGERVDHLGVVAEEAQNRYPCPQTGNGFGVRGKTEAGDCLGGEGVVAHASYQLVHR